MAASKKEKPIIEVKHLSKQYSIGVDRTYKRFSESLTSAMRHPLKTLKDSRRQNDTFWALKDVNFEIGCGEVVGIIGRNGAGKSTLLKILSRITYPTEGEVRMCGRVGSLLEVGTGFHPELSGRENIYFNGSILGMKKREIDEKFDEIVKFSGVEKFLDTPVKRYSSGMNVRLAFSVAAHLEPEILVVDEVLAVGDAEFQKKCLGKMEDVAKEGRTVLFVSHNMGAINQLCSRCILLQNGSVAKEGDVNSCVDKYLSDTVKRCGTIISHGERKTDHINIDKIKINNLEQDQIILKPKAKFLEIEIMGQVVQSVYINIEARLISPQNNVIGIFSPGYMNGGTKKITPGSLHIKSIIQLPMIIKGTYYLSITIYDPGIISLWEFPMAAEIIAEGCPTKTGLVFEQKMGIGSMIFPGKTVYYDGLEDEE
ncbi:Teichoic acid export ATP-binding protein TagH [Methanosarcina lacustris Z-7289]|uniref:Teichoic acid export ATP-binding protein TagH n=1 Tax=Methanosarcina lacustris Z-7289 TaxID=1434111 RepID=A0A0E3S5P3_9EURY|nr:ABC transporter ATP-binding protein [Methanosarcina lacustris]AKB75706.1 Teichoic acid export ATP-binding protein TagH [Methanosarcina lacustris Z-7289]